MRKNKSAFNITQIYRYVCFYFIDSINNLAIRMEGKNASLLMGRAFSSG